MRIRRIYCFLVSFVFLSFLAGVQFATPNLVDNDGFYHIKMAYLMRTMGLKPVFDWLPLTILNPREFVDHHFLFHILLIPFTYGDLRTGAKLASVIFPALAFLAVWWLLRGQEIPLAPLWSFGLLAVSEAFIYRMSMPRAQSLSLAALALGLHFLYKKRYVWLAILSFLYVWLYDAFPLILALAGMYSLACLIVERRLVWKPVAFAALGVALGMVVNPYFPANVVFLFRHLSPKLANATATSVGSEWYPYRTDQLVEQQPGPGGLPGRGACPGPIWAADGCRHGYEPVRLHPFWRAAFQVQAFCRVLPSF